MIPRTWIGTLFVGYLALCSLPAAAEELKLSGEFVDGSRATGAISEWNRGLDQAKFAGRAIFDRGNPLRWWKNDSLPQPLPAHAFVEMFGGDRLPGRVTGIGGELGDGPPAPPQVVVEPYESLAPFEVSRRGLLRVLTRWIRRIVWERRKSDQYVPNTAFFRDGGQATFRSLRFTDQGVVLLTDQGRQNVAYGDLAEIHMPRQKAWDMYLEQIAIVAPRVDGARIVQLEAVSGLRATASLERFDLVSLAPQGQPVEAPQSWWQRLQPAWLRDPIWVRFNQVQTERFFAPQEVPLSMLEPSRAVQRSVLSGSWRAQVDRNADGQSLIGGGQTFGWGWGVHAYSELTFELPPATQSFRSRFGLDQSVGRGGCVRGWIYANQAGTSPLFSTKYLVGSSEMLDTGNLALGGPKAGQTSLVLVVDPAHEGRPAGADPFDIRDVANWFEPILTLDPKQMQSEINACLPRVAPGWDRLTLNETDRETLAWQNHWEKFSSNSLDRYFLEARPGDSFVTWSTTLRIEPNHSWLTLWASRNADAAKTMPSRLQVRIDGRAVVEYVVPPRPPHGEVPPLWIPIEKYRGREVKLEVVQIGDGPKSFVEFGGLHLWERPPGLLQVALAPDRITGAENFEFTGADRFRAERSVKVSAGGKVRIRLDGVHISGSNSPGEYRFIHFAWKKVGGSRMEAEFLRAATAPGGKQDPPPKFGIYYGPTAAGKPNEQWSRVADQPPADWVEANLDLLQSHGQISFNLEAIEFTVPDGEYALLDDIYFYRRYEDRDLIPRNAPQIKEGIRRKPPNKQGAVFMMLRGGEFSRALSEFAPSFSVVPSEYRWEIKMLDEFNGRKHVLKTTPGNDRDAVYTAPIACPAGKSTKLNLSLACEASGSWSLDVVANGETLSHLVVDKNTAKEGWLDATVDLSKFAGKKALLELRQKSKTDPSAMAYWSKLEIRSE